MNEQNLRPAPQWKPGQSGNPNGRPKSKAKAEIEALMKRIKGAKKAKQFETISNVDRKEWDSFLRSCDTNTLKLLIQDDNTRAYVKCMAMAILTDMHNGRTNTMDKITERVDGKVIQRYEVTGADGQPIGINAKVADMTDEEMDQQIAELTRRLQQ